MARPFGAKGKKPRKDKSLIPEAARRAVACKKYEKTLKGLLMRTYRNMKSRVLGIQNKKAHLYKGLYLLDKNEFYDWALNNENYTALFVIWSASNYSRKLTPSIDRIDTTKGYELSNMRWVTHSENSRNGAISQWQNR